MGWLQGIMKNVNLIMFFFTEVTICFFCRENQFYCEREVVTRYCSIYNNLHVRFTNKITSGPPVINDSFNVILFTSVEIFESLILLNFEIWTELGHWVIKCKISLVVNFLPKIINFDPDTWCGGAELRVTVGRFEWCRLSCLSQYWNHMKAGHDARVC